MSSNKPEEPVDPYLPPKSNIGELNISAHLKHDGYTYLDQLVANKNFKPPLICAKLGTQLSPGSHYQLKEITVKRVPKANVLYSVLIILATVMIATVYYLLSASKDTLPLIIIAPFLLIFLSFINSEPYKISFHLSEQHLRRHRYLMIPLVIMRISIATGLILYIIDTSSMIPLYFVAIALIHNIYHFKMIRFRSSKVEGSFHFIKGTHKNFLDVLPHLKLS